MMLADSQKRFLGLFGALLAAGGIAAACSNALGGGGPRQASLSFHVVPTAAASLVAAGGPLSLVVGDATHSVDIQSVDIVFSEITFEARDAADADDEESDDADDDSDSEHEGDARFEVGAATVSLPVEGGVITPFNGQLPVGTFDGLEMDAEFARIRGTVDGQPFDVTIQIDKELEIDFEPPFVVEEGGDPINVSVNIDVASWFKDANGAVIDPRLLATDATLREQFRNRVRASFRAFEDQDKDADEDDSDSDGDDGHGDG